MQRAVTGLQGLMEEAVQVARDAARQNNPDEVAAVLNEATLALRKASTVHGLMTESLQLSESEIGVSSDDYMDSSSESDAGRSSRHLHGGFSEETAPTVFTTSVQSVQSPYINPPYIRDGKKPHSEEAAFGPRRGGKH